MTIVSLHNQPESQVNFLQVTTNRGLIVVTGVIAFVYLLFLAVFMPKGAAWLFYALVVGEVFHFWQIMTYLYTVWRPSRTVLPVLHYQPSVDVFITVAGEPVEIVEETARAALAMDYHNHSVYLLNDGYVANKPNWQDIEALAHRLGIGCITRTVPGGAKAGNINHALQKTNAALVAVFDADQVPHPDFLQKTVGYFNQKAMGFVQSPQYYKNYATNEITAGSWEQQELFFGPVCEGKNRLNATFMCGTNMVVRRQALMAVGGMCETNIAEDFLTSLFLHEQGWKSVYVPEVLAEGLAPEDFLSYYKQQFRWARGSLEVIFKYNPLFRRGLSWPQKLQYLASASFYLSGIVVLLNALLPLFYFYTGKVPLLVSTMALAAVFLPYIFLVIVTLQLTSNYSFTFRAVAFSISSFTIHFQALWAVLTNQKSGFSVTAKKGLQGNFLHLTIPHMVYLLATLGGVGVAIVREGISAAFLSNFSWALFYSASFSLFIAAALPAMRQSPVIKNGPARLRESKQNIKAVPVTSIISGQ